MQKQRDRKPESLDMPHPNHPPPSSTTKHRYSLQSVTATDLPSIADLVHKCKMALPINRLLFVDWPNDAAQKPLYKQAVESGFEDKNVENWKVVHEYVDSEDGSEGEGEGEGEKGKSIAGFFCLTRKRPVERTSFSATGPLQSDPNPGTEPATRTPVAEGGEEEGGGGSSTPAGIEPGLLSAVTKAVTEIAQGTDSFDHFEVTYICVQPHLRRRGIGRLLMEQCLARARAENIPVVVCAEPAAYSFFVALGFRDREIRPGGAGGEGERKEGKDARTRTRHADIDLTRWAPNAYAGFGVFRLSGMQWTP